MTPAQTIGPFFSHALPWPSGPLVVSEQTPHSFWVRGKVFDGAGTPVPDALIESWQQHENFSGFGRCPTDNDGNWALHTVKTPYLAISVFARGLLHRLVTRIYFPGQSDDAVLSGLPADRRATLIARPAPDGYYHDIQLQGEHETVFFSL
jgi:protocatechuate 3,4-dioxygenase alpha subunit